MVPSEAWENLQTIWGVTLTLAIKLYTTTLGEETEYGRGTRRMERKVRLFTVRQDTRRSFPPCAIDPKTEKCGELFFRSEEVKSSWFFQSEAVVRRY